MPFGDGNYCVLRYCVLYCFRDLASLGIMLLGIFFGGLSGLALLHGFAATGRTRFNCCGGYKRRLLGRCCIGFVSELDFASYLESERTSI